LNITCKVVQIWPGQTVTCLHTNSPGHIWTTFYNTVLQNCSLKLEIWAVGITFGVIYTSILEA
jgi:hypothetical protein